MNANTYHVWRRSDGYVNATCTSAGNPFTSYGSRDTFTILLSTASWVEARKVIVVERAKADYPAFD